MELLSLWEKTDTMRNLSQRGSHLCFGTRPKGVIRGWCGHQTFGKGQTSNGPAIKPKSRSEVSLSSRISRSDSEEIMLIDRTHFERSPANIMSEPSSDIAARARAAVAGYGKMSSQGETTLVFQTEMATGLAKIFGQGKHSEGGAVSIEVEGGFARGETIPGQNGKSPTTPGT